MVDLGKLTSYFALEFGSDNQPGKTDNQANVYGGARTGVSTDAAIEYFTGAGADAFKINMGMLAPYLISTHL